MAFEIIASLNVGDSAKEIEEKIKSQLNPEVNKGTPLKLIASIDTSKTVQQINSQLSNLTGLKMPTIQINTNNNNIQATVNSILQEQTKQQKQVSEKQEQTEKQQAKEKERILKEQTKQQEQAIKQQEQTLKSYNSVIDNSIKKLSQMSNTTVFKNNSTNTGVQKTLQDISKLQNGFDNLKGKLSQNLTPQGIQALGVELNNLISQFNTTTNSAHTLSANLRNDNSFGILQARVENLKLQMQSYINLNQKAVKGGFGDSLNNLLRDLNKVANTSDFNKIRTEFARTKQEINTLGLTGNTVFGTLKEKISKFASWMGITMVTASVAREIRDMFKTVVDLDTALVDLNKTFQGTQAELEGFYLDANNVAKSLGSTTEEIINSASAWSRLGYSTAEACTKMAEFSSIFKSISPGMDMDTATDGLVSMMKAFGINVENVQSEIMDKINTLGNNFATSNSELVEAMKRSSSAMAAGNNSLEEALAINTASIEITRNAESTATAWKTVSMRLRGYDEETEELSDDLKTITGEIANLTKVASNNNQGVSLFTDETKETYKSTYEIMNDIANIWDEMSDKNQAELLEKIAGKRNGQVVASALSNWDAAKKAMQDMENATGSSAKEMEKYYDSLEYKINQFKETITGIAQSSIARDFLKSVVEDGTKLLETLTSVGNVTQPIFNLFSSGVSSIEKITSAFGGLDKVLLGLATSKIVNSGFKNIFGADRVRMITLYNNMSA